MADSGDATAKALLEAEVREDVLNLAHISLGLAGALSVPDPPAVPKPARLRAIAATVVELTGWTSVPFDTVATVYLWLFGDEALYLMGTEMRVEAGLQMLENRQLREVRVTHPGTGELVLVTWEEILKHADDDRRALEAAQRYEEAQRRRHERLIAALRPTATAPPPSATPYGERPPTWGSTPPVAASRRWPSS
jgi:hypothetical protein